MPLLRLPATLLLFVLAAALQAQDNTKENYSISTNRPTVSYSSNTVPVGAFQIELGYFWSRTTLKTSLIHLDAYNSALPNFAIRTGISPRWELLLGWDLFASSLRDRNLNTRSSTEISSGALTLGTKIQIIDQAEGAKPQLAFFGATLLPFTQSGYSANNSAYSALFRFCATHQLSEKWSLFYNAGADFYEANSILQTRAALTLGIGFAPINGLSVFAETYNFMPLRYFSYRHGGNIGLAYALKGRYQFDLMAGFELGENTKTPLFTAGFSTFF